MTATVIIAFARLQWCNTVIMQAIVPHKQIPYFSKFRDMVNLLHHKTNRVTNHLRAELTSKYLLHVYFTKTDVNQSIVKYIICWTVTFSEKVTG
jgi:hypothetical protein